jgi:hypothetical protein
MPVLEFEDSNGVRWRVWSTIPRASVVLPSEHRGGWLTFDSELGRRRLVPLPAGWESAPPDRLELLCRSAVEVPRLTGELPRAERPVDWPNGES